MVSEPTRPGREKYLAFLGEGAFRLHAGPKPDYSTAQQLRAIAANFSTEGCHSYAGHVFYRAIDAVWGDGEAIKQFTLDATREFQRAIGLADVDDHERAAALQMLTVATGMNYADIDPSEVRISVNVLYEELGQQLLRMAEHTTDPATRAGVLVQGFTLETRFDGFWRPIFDGTEVDGSGTRYGNDSLSIEVPSAFTLFRRAADYEAAEAAASMCPDEAFTSPGLRGWRIAIGGFLRPDEAVERFRLAAAEFATDTYDPERTGHWSSINVDLWAKYFFARAALAEIVRRPEEATALLRQAEAALEGTETGWGNPQATCLRVLVDSLNEILDGNVLVGAPQAKDALLRRARFSGIDEADRLVIEFIDHAVEAFALLTMSPTDAVTSSHLADALETLGRISFIGDEIAAVVRPKIGERVIDQLLGPHRSWIHRTLESIADERVFQRVLLRLMQARLPLYAQIRHGPLEYGKDIAVLADVGGQARLEMYQVKVGDISMPAWAPIRAQVEQIFQVEMNEVQLPVIPDGREGVLIFNGHFNLHVEPVVQGWLKEQREQLGRLVRVMNLDDIVTWIIRGGLVNELRQALSESGIEVADSS
jgi:hypothetical protein